MPGPWRHEVRERIGADGTVVTELDEAQARAAIRRLRDEGAQTIAVCLLHSYANPVHERRLGALIREEHPGAYVSLSSDVMPEFREFERLSTTVLNAYVVPDRWAIGGPMGLTGGALRWFGETFLSPENASSSDPLFHVLDRLAAKAEPGADGVIFLPGLSGDRVPRWNPAARGVVFGLSAEHQMHHIVRALFEGCAYTLADAVNAVVRLGVDIGDIRVAGGGAASDLWLRIRAGALGRPLNVVKELEASSLGAAIAAGVGVGVYADFPTAVNEAVTISHRIEPGPTLVETYRAYYQVYQQLYRQLEPAFADLAKLRQG